MKKTKTIQSAMTAETQDCRSRMPPFVLTNTLWPVYGVLFYINVPGVPRGLMMKSKSCYLKRKFTFCGMKFKATSFFLMWICPKDSYSWPYVSLLHEPISHLDKMAPISADDIFKWIFLNENCRIPIPISLKFVLMNSQEPNWQKYSIGSGNGLAPNRRQAIT